MHLDHVQIHVADIAQSRDWYAKHFGLTEVVFEDPGICIVRAPGTEGILAIHPGDAPNGALHGHFGFRVGSLEEVRAHRERWRAAGLVEAEFQDNAGGFAFARVIDPDGHHVEVYSRP